MIYSEFPIRFHFPENLWSENPSVKNRIILKIHVPCERMETTGLHVFLQSLFSVPPVARSCWKHTNSYVTHTHPTPCDWTDKRPVSWNLSYLIQPCVGHMRHSELISHSQRLSSFLIFFKNPPDGPFSLHNPAFTPGRNYTTFVGSQLESKKYFFSKIV